MSVPSPQSIALCLSGGGLRATFYHLGVVRLLRDAGLLKSVSHVFSVSGGSILAAHMVLNWRDYSETGPQDDRFLERALELCDFGRHDMRGRIVRRLALLGWLPQFHRTRQLERHYAALLRNAELGSLRVDTPQLHVLATSMVTGNLCSFSRDGFSVDDGENVRTFTCSGFPLARAVAASSAFPPMFPSVQIERSDINAGASEFPHAEYLTDGGVFDNLGVHALERVANEQSGFDVIAVSDASAGFDWRLEKRRAGIVSRTTRTTDILMRRVAALEERAWRGKPGVIAIPIREVAREIDLGERTQWFSAQDPDVQKLVKSIRTDLNEFSITEMSALIKHGYEVALQVLAEERLDLLEQRRWEADDPAPVGWMQHEPITIIQGARQASHLVQAVTTMSEVMEEGARKIEQAAIKAGARPPSAEHRERERQLELTRIKNEQEAQEDLRELREDIRAGSARRLGLWNASDWASWVLLLTPLCVLAAMFWLLA